MIVVFATSPLQSLLDTVAVECFPDDPEQYFNATQYLERLVKYLVGTYPPHNGVENDDPYMDTLEELLTEFLARLGYPFCPLDLIGANPDRLNFFLVLEITDGYPRTSEH